MLVPDDIRESCAIVQDVDVPSNSVDKLQKFLDDEINVYPLWFCPLRHISCPERLFAAPEIDDVEWFLNVGVYGMPRKENFDYIKANIGLEKTLTKLNGRKGLYAHCYYKTAEDFWENYDKKKYTDIRFKYKADGAFMDLYEKITKSMKVSLKNKK